MNRATLSQAEQQIILLSASIAAHRQDMHEHTGRLMVDVDWSRLAEVLQRRRLLPTLGPRVLDLAEERASTDFTEAVTQAIEAGRRYGAFLQFASLHVMGALAETGIRSTALKGPLLSEAIYGDLGRRLSRDIDLLVATEQLHAAVDVVRQLGYAAPIGYVEHATGLPQLHFLLIHQRQKLPPVELHWRVHWYERDFARNHLLPPAVNPASGWRPAPEDELVALLLFYARDGFVDLRLAADLSAWWDAFGVDLQPGALDGLLRAYPALARAVRVSANVAESIVGLPATQVFSDSPSLGIRDRIAARMANPNPKPNTSRSQLAADMGLIDGLLMPTGDFGAFVRRQVLLPREVLDEFDRYAPKRRARSSLGRGVGMLGRYGLTLARLALPSNTLR